MPGPPTSVETFRRVEGGDYVAPREPPGATKVTPSCYHSARKNCFLLAQFPDYSHGQAVIVRGVVSEASPQVPAPQVLIARTK